MDLKPEDIKEINDAGELHGDKVKVIKTFGGLYVMVGKKDKDSKKPDVLAAASHKALAAHQLEKMYGRDFRPSLAKSEGEIQEQVIDFITSKELSDANLAIQAIQKSNEVDFVISSFGVVLEQVSCSIFKNELNIQKYEQKNQSKVNQDVIKKDLSKAIEKYCEINKIGFKK